MKVRDDELNLRPGRIRHGNQAVKRPKSFVGQVMRAAKKAGHIGESFEPGRAGATRSRFGRGRRAALALSMRSTSRRVVMKARVVRHQGTRFRSAPLPKHMTYLKREGVTRDGVEGKMFDASSDAADERSFAERCEGDRHHFRFIISPEDAAELENLRTFTRELMGDVARDLGTRLDWVAVDHWNTDNPHVHVLIRGRGDDGQDLVISRDYISRGFRDRAAERVAFELGPRTEHEIRSALEREVEAERWTSLDRALRHTADHGAGIADLRPGAPEDPELRRLLLGRAAKLERLGLAEQVETACWTLKPGIEQTLRDLGTRGDIIKTMHRVMTSAGREPDIAGFALHGDDPGEPVRGRLVGRGLHDELKGSAYAVVEGVDSRTHHLRFSDLEVTGDAKVGAIVEARVYDDAMAESGFRWRRGRTLNCKSRLQRRVRPGLIANS
jgi:type IV secretory pathway VirD2 relaxase